MFICSCVPPRPFRNKERTHVFHRKLSEGSEMDYSCCAGRILTLKNDISHSLPDKNNPGEQSAGCRRSKEGSDLISANISEFIFISATRFIWVYSVSTRFFPGGMFYKVLLLLLRKLLIWQKVPSDYLFNTEVGFNKKKQQKTIKTQQYYLFILHLFIHTHFPSDKLHPVHTAPERLAADKRGRYVRGTVLEELFRIRIFLSGFVN